MIVIIHWVLSPCLKTVGSGTRTSRNVQLYQIKDSKSRVAQWNIFFLCASNVLSIKSLSFFYLHRQYLAIVSWPMLGWAWNTLWLNLHYKRWASVSENGSGVETPSITTHSVRLEAFVVSFSSSFPDISPLACNAWHSVKAIRAFVCVNTKCTCREGNYDSQVLFQLGLTSLGHVWVKLSEETCHVFKTKFKPSLYITDSSVTLPLVYLPWHWIAVWHLKSFPQCNKRCYRIARHLCAVVPRPPAKGYCRKHENR